MLSSVLITHSCVCAAFLLRDVRYSTDNEGRRHLRCCIMEISGSDAIEMPRLPVHHFPILPDTTEVTFEHVACASVA